MEQTTQFTSDSLGGAKGWMCNRTDADLVFIDAEVEVVACFSSLGGCLFIVELYVLVDLVNFGSFNIALRHK